MSHTTPPPRTEGSNPSLSATSLPGETPGQAGQNPALVTWLQRQLAKFEQSLAARESMAESWAGGTTESWRQAGCRLNKNQRMEHSRTHARIAAKCRHDVEMCQAVLALVILEQKGPAV